MGTGWPGAAQRSRLTARTRLGPKWPAASLRSLPSGPGPVPEQG